MQAAVVVEALPAVAVWVERTRLALGCSAVAGQPAALGLVVGT